MLATVGMISAFSRKSGAEHAGDRRTGSCRRRCRPRPRSIVMSVPDDVRVAAEHPLPESVAQDHDRRLPRHVVLRSSSSRPWSGFAPSSVKQAGRGRAAPRRVRGCSRPSSVPLRPCEIDISSNERFSFWMSMYCPGDGQSCGNVDPRRPQPQHGQPVGIRIRQRLQQQRVDDAEDRRVGADADRQRRDDDERQPPALRRSMRRA